MNRKELSELNDQELLEEAKNLKPSPVLDAVFIGFLIGIIIYSAAKSTWGLVTLVPMFLIYSLLKKSTQKKELESILKKRNS